MKKSGVSTQHLIHSQLISVISISLVLLLLGIMAVLLRFAGDLTTYVRENLTVSVVLSDEVKEADIHKLVKKLDAEPYVRTSRFIDRQTALAELTEELGQNPMDILDYNPLRASVEIKLNSVYTESDSVAVVDSLLSAMPGVEDVIYQKNLIDQVNTNVKDINLILLGFSLLLLLISYALISNTVRLTVYAKRFLIHTMQLVGATGAFIRRPFVWRGVLIGFLSALLAIAMLSSGLYWISSQTSGLFTLQRLNGLAGVFGLMVLLGIVITLISTALAVSRYLRSSNDELYKM
ncbi:MAG: permease-like cell division protein FtsX [Paludibacteraceae bacterium]|nr:permease-like cell division protein FtsX [Paludibacteraceae bacterium]